MEIEFVILGWYFDIDTIHMKNLDDFKHRSIFSIDSVLTDPGTGLKTSSGQSIANGAFHIVKNESQFLWRVMDYYKKQYSPELWTSGGSDIITKAFKVVCNIKPHDYDYDRITGEQYLSISGVPDHLSLKSIF